MPVPPLDAYRHYPRMAHWFDPVLLFKLLINVLFVLDLRLIRRPATDDRGALDTAEHPAKLRDRAAAAKATFPENPDGSDLGKISSLTSATDLTAPTPWPACSPAQLSPIGGLTLPRGQGLIMGGDEVYPKATENAYRYQLRMPYLRASPDPDPDAEGGVPLYAVPGNHDWYDGLVLFLAYFCGHKTTHFGRWRAYQRRSYFAIQSTETWWLWAIDIQLADNMDQPQFDYFTIIAEDARELEDHSCAAPNQVGSTQARIPNPGRSPITLSA